MGALATTGGAMVSPGTLSAGTFDTECCGSWRTGDDQAGSSCTDSYDL